MDRNELIEEAAKAISETLLNRSATGGYGSFREATERALAVFEQAHTPTDDDREALVDAFDEMHRITEGGCDTLGEDVADMVLGLGFRRTVQGEPTDAAVLAALNGSGKFEHHLAGIKRQWNDAPSLNFWGEEAAESMRAALRAAAAVREEGQRHGA